MVDAVLSMIAPHHCFGCGFEGVVLCDCCKNNILDEPFSTCLVCGVSAHDNLCESHDVPYQRAWCVATRTGVIAEVIDSYKFHGVRAAHQPLAQLLHEVLPALPAQTVIVPVPTTPRNVRIRGYDHMELMARELARLGGWQLASPLQRRNNVTQHFAETAAARRAQAKEFFEVKIEVDNTVPYVIIDDIFTTGSTIEAAACCLRDAGAEQVWVAVIARQHNH